MSFVLDAQTVHSFSVFPFYEIHISRVTYSTVKVSSPCLASLMNSDRFRQMLVGMGFSQVTNNTSFCRYYPRMFARKLVQSSTVLRRLYCTAPKSKEEIDRIVKSGKVVLFMKGTPEEPMCGFSRVVAQILRMHDVKYQSVNVLEDQGVREGVKKYSDWPTIPQLYVDGKFVGGADITLQVSQLGLIVSFSKGIDRFPYFRCIKAESWPKC